MFYSTAINSLADFADYLAAKGYKALSTTEVAGDGYYAQFQAGSAKIKDFSQTCLTGPGRATCWGNGKPSSTEWARLSFKDCTNKFILNS